MKKEIVVCDDHILFLSGISEILKKFGNNYNIITFNDSNACKNHLKKNKVDVFICDLNIDHSDGFALIKELKNELKTTKIIILTAYFEDFLIEKARKLGFHAFMRKESTSKELISAVEADITTPFFTNKKASSFDTFYKNKDKNIVHKFRISKQEKEIIREIIKGKTSKEIAQHLFISKTTVDTHRKNINKKLEINNVSSLIKFVNESNLFS
jgi:DNA-binding NarL/FixJ family response regulator